MQAATTRANQQIFYSTDLGLASFDPDDFDVTDGWVTIKGGSIDLDDLPNWQPSALARSTAGTGVRGSKFSNSCRKWRRYC